ncbi:MAG: 4-hydroxy-3-methylbut-2-enyl diphosphate reductase [Desulfohalobiaceae bacterium]
MTQTILRAPTAGFCMGVDLALKRLETIVADTEDTSTISTLGPIIHNPQVLDRYAHKGVRQIKSLDQVVEPGRIVIRAHGIPRDMQQALEQKEVTLIDATCPRVKKAQLLIAGQAAKGRRLLLFGEPDHPEVIGLLSYADAHSLVFENLDQLKSLALDPSIPSFLAAQTTQDREEFVTIHQYLMEVFPEDIPVFDTICDATRERQREAKDIAAKVELMVVVGGYNSGNTRRLVQVARSIGTSCIHVEHAGELDPASFGGIGSVGITAGASTPRDLIDAVQDRIEHFFHQG